MRFIFIGDVVGKGGREAVHRLVPDLRREFNAQFVVVNGENSAGGNGLTGACARELLQSCDVVTSGDHTWDQKGFDLEIGSLERVIRPANYNRTQPGRGFGVFANPAGGSVAVIALQGRVFRWLIWLSLFILVIIYGKYGPGYHAADFIYQGF